MTNKPGHTEPLTVEDRLDRLIEIVLALTLATYGRESEIGEPLIEAIEDLRATDT